MSLIPFNLQLAKQIQAGVLAGKIVTRERREAFITCWCTDNEKKRIQAFVRMTDREMAEIDYSNKGIFFDEFNESVWDLMLELYEFPYKDGDVLSNIDGDFVFILNGNGSYKTSSYVCLHQNNKISFHGVASGNDTEGYKYATEEEKQRLINALKKSTDSRAKQYLKRFFGIERKHEFKPFDKVLVKDNDNKWCVDFFSHFDSEEKYKPFNCVGGMAGECIPYNEQTKHLLGTTDDYKI